MKLAGHRNSRLGEVVKFIGGSQPPKSSFIGEEKEGYVRLLQIRDYKTDAYKTYIPKDKARRFCFKDDIMIGRYGPPIFQILRGLEGAYNVALMKAEPSPELTKDYLYYFLSQKTLFNFIEGLSQRTAGQSGVDMDGLKKYPILVPPIPEQKRIAAILDKADAIRRKRQQAIKLADDFLRATFLDMFGKYLNDESTHKEIKKIADFIDYRGKTPPRVPQGIPLINAKCVRQGYFDDSRIDYIEEETYKKVMTRGYPKSDDVLFTTEGATMGYTCRIPAKYDFFAVGQRLITLQCKNNYSSIVLEYFINHPLIQEEIKKRATGSAAQGIRSAEFAKIIIPFPPKHSQEIFSKIVKKTETIKKKYHMEPANLFNSLTQRAFRGEL